MTTFTFTQNVDAQSLVPEWIKNNAGWWANGEIDDKTFLDGIKFLIENRIIDVPSESQTIDVDKLTIGFIPVEKADELTSKAKVLEEFLENKLGVEVEIVIPTNYETIIEGMRFGHVDAAFMDTGPAWITHQRTGAEAVLAELVAGKVNYQATVWTLAKNDSIHTLEDTVGKRVAFTSITGSSGFVRPMGTLVTDGHIKIEGNDIVALESALAKNFESYTFAGGYKAALQLLLNENVDVAFGSDIAPQKYLELEDQVKLRPVTTIGPVPSHVFMVNADMSENTKNALVDSLIELNYDENNEILTNLYGAEALVPTTTTMHIGEFGTFIDALTGLDQKILDSYNKSK
ncbi:MAG: phosphate/phosphite/phosphonate ABC transporter substrate-binding protein [Nitrosopumilus sp.]|nr:phosphate/phosphite/phosphonate ABC transporter substrate-binding protein [Nitrosopumilus sp.]